MARVRELLVSLGLLALRCGAYRIDMKYGVVRGKGWQEEVNQRAIFSSANFKPCVLCCI